MAPGATATTQGILNPGAGRAAFSLVRHAPSPDLAEFIERHWVVRWDLRGRAPFVQELLPHPCVNLVFEGERGAVHGIPRRRGSRVIKGHGWALGTKFRPGGFAPFTTVPMSSLSERAISLVDAFGPDGERLGREAGARDDVAGRIAVVESFLQLHRPQPDAERQLVTRVVSAMLAAPPGTRVDELARGHGLSTRGLQRLFRRHVGVGPKWVLRRYRMHEAAERIGAGERLDYAELALELGYFDQAHFNRDFRALLGTSPSEYARACQVAVAA
jgi:AraC-like DNA-binding protein